MALLDPFLLFPSNSGDAFSWNFVVDPIGQGVLILSDQSVNTYFNLITNQDINMFFHPDQQNFYTLGHQQLQTIAIAFWKKISSFIDEAFKIKNDNDFWMAIFIIRLQFLAHNKHTTKCNY